METKILLDSCGSYFLEPRGLIVFPVSQTSVVRSYSLFGSAVRSYSLLGSVVRSYLLFGSISGVIRFLAPHISAER